MSAPDTTPTTAQVRHEAFTLSHYERIGRGEMPRPAIRSAHGDAAHMCDAIAADIRSEHTVRGRVTKKGEELAAAVERAGDAIWHMREQIK